MVLDGRRCRSLHAVLAGRWHGLRERHEQLAQESVEHLPLSGLERAEETLLVRGMRLERGVDRPPPERKEAGCAQCGYIRTDLCSRR
jgi:hypothetical protein